MAHFLMKCVCSMAFFFFPLYGKVEILGFKLFSYNMFWSYSINSPNSLQILPPYPPNAMFFLSLKKQNKTTLKKPGVCFVLASYSRAWRLPWSEADENAFPPPSSCQLATASWLEMRLCPLSLGFAPGSALYFRLLVVSSLADYMEAVKTELHRWQQGLQQQNSCIFLMIPKSGIGRQRLQRRQFLLRPLS